MNRLILVGNGFDLAHGLKTDYNSFIVWYLKECFNKALNAESGSHEYYDNLIGITCRGSLSSIPQPYNTIDKFIDYMYENGFSNLLNTTIEILDDNHFNPFKLTFKLKLSEELISRCNNKNWVDIENEFYRQLKKCKTDKGVNVREINELNTSLKFIIEQLELYLSSLRYNTFHKEYSTILSSKIILTDILKSKIGSDQIPKETQILNFNYTPTVEAYLKNYSHTPYANTKLEINHIHGEINDSDNRLIFGFGDEIDEEYKKIERTNINEFFEYIKSFWYFKTSNYQNLMRFVGSDEYQIYILGHSCGLSDRTLLHMLFEHTNCKSIKIYYHGDKKKNNYTRLTHEISRHFNDKEAMRNKIVPFNKCFPMPQVYIVKG